MKELFDSLEHVDMETKGLKLLDTCFVFDLLSKQKKLPEGRYAITSFNVEELLKVGHRLHKMKRGLRDFVKKNDLVVVEVPVHIGNFESEKAFVRSVDNELLKLIPDASDAVLLTVAVKTKSSVYTKDKHHLFTVRLENYLAKYGIKVFKEIKG
tara:strand:+ start:1970 stop:2431 length:462 start_codon:yes stop_codon:yes gene_type:complete